MSDELTLKKLEVTSQIICQLIQKDVLPTGLTKRGGLSIDEVTVTLGTLFQKLWRYIDAVPDRLPPQESPEK
jgi:hypothetical protein